MSGPRRSARLARKIKHSGPLEATNAPLLNSMKPINKLPLEVLINIFTLGEGMARGPRAVGLPYVGFQDLVTRVCHHWRTIAIHTPALWTYIYISRPPPHLLAQLYISRSGACPLVIDIDMRTPYVRPFYSFDLEKHTTRLLETLQYIVAEGGGTQRWGSLILLSKVPGPIFKVIQFLNGSPSPALRFLSLKWKRHPAISDLIEQDAMDHLSSLHVPENMHSLTQGPQRPQLRQVELSSLPVAFIFNRARPIFSNLTKLTFIGLGQPPPIRGFSSLLSTSPQLESLVVDMGFIFRESGGLENASLASLRVKLPLLRNFSLHIPVLESWGLQLLQIVDAPGLQYFELSLGWGYQLGGVNLLPIFQYLSAGRVSGALRCAVSSPKGDQHPDEGPIFPSLCRLNAERVEGPSSMRLLFPNAFPTVTHVRLRFDWLQILFQHPKLFPSATHFTFIPRGLVCDDLRCLLSFATARAANNVKITVLEIEVTSHTLEAWRVITTSEDQPDLQRDKYVSLMLQVVETFRIHKLLNRPEDPPDSDNELALDWDEDEDGTGSDLEG